MRDRNEIEHVLRNRAALVGALAEAGATVDGGKVKCPFHDDQHPSGGVHQGKDDASWLYTCHGCEWNGETGTGDVLAVVQRSRGCGFTEACDHLGIRGNGQSLSRGNGQATSKRDRSNDSTDPSKPSSATERDKARQDALLAHSRLMGDADALEHLWNTRGIDAATVKRFGLGVLGKHGDRRWVLPITRGGEFVGFKAHRADGQSAKTWWAPKGSDRGQAWPAELKGSDPVWLCPGELKALAVIAMGRPAVGITSGEGSEKNPNDLPTAAIELLRGRSVAIVSDDDPVGWAWGAHVQKQLADSSIDARVVDLGFDRGAGIGDVGDWTVRKLTEDAREPESVAATLDDKWRRSDPWHGVLVGDQWSDPRTWSPVTVIPSGLTSLDYAIGGGFRTRGVHLVAGKPGNAKTQFGATIVTNAAIAKIPTVLFSVELGADEIAQLVAAQLGDIPRTSLAMGKVTGEYGQRLNRVRERYGRIPLSILDTDRWEGGLTRDRFTELVADGVRRFGWRLVVLDYLGLLAPSDSDRTDFQTDLLHSAALRRIARRNDIALVVIVALRKSGNFKKEKGAADVTLDDVAGAGRLAYDAQSVLLISSEHGDKGCGLVTVRPLKLRFAPLCTDTAPVLRWWAGCGRIEDMPREYGV